MARSLPLQELPDVRRKLHWSGLCYKTTPGFDNTFLWEGDLL